MNAERLKEIKRHWGSHPIVNECIKEIEACWRWMDGEQAEADELEEYTLEEDECDPEI
jgi:hypothetical protein